MGVQHSWEGEQQNLGKCAGTPKSVQHAFGKCAVIRKIVQDGESLKHNLPYSVFFTDDDQKRPFNQILTFCDLLMDKKTVTIFNLLSVTFHFLFIMGRQNPILSGGNLNLLITIYQCSKINNIFASQEDIEQI